MTGPLEGVRVVELAGIGPGPFCGMVLADYGADVIQVHRGPVAALPEDPLDRGRRSVVLDLKIPAAVDALLRIVDGADVLIEGYRPGVAERLGVGPDVCCQRNPQLVYGRMTGWGQEGPLALNAGHDINYISVAGALEGIGRADGPPTPPANLVGDFGGGGMLLALGVVTALFERHRSGIGQVVDAAMVDGAALLTAGLHGMRHNDMWHDGRGTNILDSGSPRNDAYETSDGKWISIGAMEDPFFAALAERLGLTDDPAILAELGAGLGNRTHGEAARHRLADVFRQRTRAEWCRLLEPEPDLCFAPVLSMTEAPEHPHNRHRQTFLSIDGVVQPAPAPRFSRTPATVRFGARSRGSDTASVLEELGLSRSEIDAATVGRAG